MSSPYWHFIYPESAPYRFRHAYPHCVAYLYTHFTVFLLWSLPFLSNLLYNISIIHLKYIPTNVMYVPLNSWNAKIWQDLQRLNCSRRPRMNHSCCHLPDVMARNYFAKHLEYYSMDKNSFVKYIQMYISNVRVPPTVNTRFIIRCEKKISKNNLHKFCFLNYQYFVT
jgi:hypothetical protein